MQFPTLDGYWVLGLAMSVDLQDIPDVQSRYVCVDSSAMSTLIEGSEVVVWKEAGQMKPEEQESRLPCLGGSCGTVGVAVGANARRGRWQFRNRNERPANLPRLQLRRGRS